MEQKIKVMVVDDDPSVGALLKVKLEKTGRFAVTYAESREQGLEQAGLNHPDIFVLDIDLVTEDGGELASELSLNPETKNIPYLFFSSMVTPEEVARKGGVIGGQVIVSKASGWEELARVIESMPVKRR